MSAPPAPALTAARIIAGAMTLGVVLFWIVAWVMTKGGATPLAPNSSLPQGIVLTVWIALAVSTFAAALFLQRSAESVVQSVRESGQWHPETVTTVQSRLIVAWALLEGPAILSAVLLLLFGTRTVVLAAIPIFLLGMALTFPRAEWFSGNS